MPNPDETVIFDHIRGKVYTARFWVGPADYVDITDEMAVRLNEAMHERPDGSTIDWLDYAINGSDRCP